MRQVQLCHAPPRGQLRGNDIIVSRTQPITWISVAQLSRRGYVDRTLALSLWRHRPRKKLAASSLQSTADANKTNISLQHEHEVPFDGSRASGAVLCVKTFDRPCDRSRRRGHQNSAATTSWSCFRTSLQQFWKARVDCTHWEGKAALKISPSRLIAAYGNVAFRIFHAMGQL